MNLKKFSLPSLNAAEKKEIVRIAVTLFLIVGITAFALAVVNELTFRKIDENQSAKINLAMSEVMPADSYSALDISFDEESGVDAVHEAKDANGNVIGWCVQSHASGFGGEIQLVVGLDSEAKVTLVKVISMSETPGVGTKTKNPSFLESFGGKSGALTVTKGEVKSETEIAAVSGATVSSRAVTRGVNSAINAVSQIINNSAEEVGNK